MGGAPWPPTAHVLFFVARLHQQRYLGMLHEVAAAVRHHGTGGDVAGSPLVHAQLAIYAEDPELRRLLVALRVAYRADLYGLVRRTDAVGHWVDLVIGLTPR